MPHHSGVDRGCGAASEPPVTVMLSDLPTALTQDARGNVRVLIRAAIPAAADPVRSKISARWSRGRDDAHGTDPAVRASGQRR